jgi:RNA polymerase sigma-70 factor, ECF subfamily
VQAATYREASGVRTVTDSEFEARFQPLLQDGFRIALAILRDHEEAEDALQEATFSAWRSYRRFRGDDAAARVWFFTIVTNQCRSRLRSSWWRRGRALGSDPRLDQLESRPQEVDIERRADLEKALVKLSWNQRAVLCLYYQLDRPQTEIAGILGIRQGAVKSRVHRAVQALREALDEGL